MGASSHRSNGQQSQRVLALGRVSSNSRLNLESGKVSNKDSLGIDLKNTAATYQASTQILDRSKSQSKTLNARGFLQRDHQSSEGERYDEKILV